MKYKIIIEQRLLYQHSQEVPDSRSIAQDSKERRKEPPIIEPTKESKEATREKNLIHQELQRLGNTVPKISNMQFREDGLLNGFTLDTHFIDCSRIPLGRNTLKTFLAILTKIVARIDGRRDLLAQFQRQPLILSKSGQCIEINERNGKRYIVTSHEVLLITEEKKDVSTEEERLKLSELERQIRELEIRTGYQDFFPLSVQEKARSSVEVSKLKYGESNRLSQDMILLYSEYEFIQMKTHALILNDEATGAAVRAYGDTLNDKYFALEREQNSTTLH